MNRVKTETVRKRVAPILDVGQSLSNIAFNLSRDKSLTEGNRAILREYQEKWDTVKQELPRWMKK